MSVIALKDEGYWLAKEEEIVPLLVDLASYGFISDHDCLRRGWTDDPRVLARRGLAENLLRAREKLPSGHNFRIVDGWRPSSVQKAVAEDARREIAKVHLDWIPEQVDKQVQIMAPPARIVPRFNSHRYGGAVDLTIIGADGQELEMGVPVNYVTGPEAALLYYEFREDITQREKLGRHNRRILLRAMESAGFDPYLPEYWHWSCDSDLL